MTNHREEAAAQNISKFMADGPRLRSDYNTWIVARDRSRGYVLVGGLGCMGMGEMWCRDEPRYASYPGYAAAEELSSEGGFGAD